MAKSYHPDILDEGLKTLSDNTGMSIVVTAGAPADLAEASTLYPTGKRVSDVIGLPASDAVLGDGAAGARLVAIASKTGEVAAGVTGQDLHIAIYDGTRLLVVNDETSDQALTQGNPVVIPSFDVEITQPS